MEDSLPQASFVAALNLKYVSVKQGVDVTANQDEIGTDETFQLEYDWPARRWALRTTQVSETGVIYIRTCSLNKKIDLDVRCFIK